MSNIIIRPLPELQVIAKAIYESNFYGFKNQQQAFTAVIASQDMGMNATRFCQDYHIINNRPSKKTETAFRDFKKAGGRIKWIKTTSDIAKAELTAPDGDVIDMEYTIEQAKQAGLLKDNYLKNPADMLRSRVLSKGIKAIYPQAYDGFLSEDEAIDLEHLEDKKEDEIIEGDIIPELDIKELKRTLTRRLKVDYNYNDAMIKEFADLFDISENVENLSKMAEDNEYLLKCIEQFEKENN